MIVKLRLSEPYWRTVGQRELELNMDPGNRVGDLLALLSKQYKGLEKEMEEAPPVIFVEEVEAGLETELADGAQVHMVWPIAGG